MEQAQALVAVDRLRERMAAHPMGDQAALTVTISAGIAQWQPGEGLEHWLERADQALYAAKHSGRNQCRLAEAPAPEAVRMAVQPSLAASPPPVAPFLASANPL
ncbi:MAG: diguanylate cyclase [Rubrivivax sp.]|nr:MAG: diguanylate cyclase [Rubrivivax sp.]